MPRYVSLTTAQIRLKYDAKDIIEAVRKTNDIRLANLATTYSIQEKTFDRMILEKFPRNNDYGFFVDNGSNVTIVSTSSCRQIGTGNFAYHIAAMGGFNYISREIDENPADYKSFYAIDDDLWDNRDNDSSFGMFISDLGTLINKESGSSKWVIFIMSTKRICESNVHFIVNAENGALTINEEEKFNEFFNGVKSKLEHQKYEMIGDISKYNPILVSLNKDFMPQTQRQLPNRLGAGKKFNSITLRINYSITARDNRNTSVQFALANQIKQDLAGNKQIPSEQTNNWKSSVIQFTETK